MIRFGTDMDDCLIDTSSQILKVLGKPGKKIYNSISRYEISKCLNIPIEIVEKVIEYVLNLENIPTIKDVEEYLPKIYTIVDYFSIITLRKPSSRPLVVGSVQNLLGETKSFHLFLSDRRANGVPDKASIIEKIKLDVFVEDRFATSLDIVEKTNCKVFLFDKPWNRNRRKHHGIIRVFSWEEIYDKLLEMREK